MLINTFVNICKDWFFLILHALNMAINSLFSMVIFWDGSSYQISIGQIGLALIAFNIVFGFIFASIKSHLGGE